jgi:hypothetical protein
VNKREITFVTTPLIFGVPGYAPIAMVPWIPNNQTMVFVGIPPRSTGSHKFGLHTSAECLSGAGLEGKGWRKYYSSSVVKRHHILVIKYCCHNVRFIIQSDDFEIFEMWNLVKNRGQSFDNRLLVVHNVEEESSFDVYRSSSSPALDWGLIDNDSKDMQR